MVDRGRARHHHVQLARVDRQVAEDAQAARHVFQFASLDAGDEIVLAGKGFNAQVEEQFKQQNQNLDYGWIDRMEQKLAVSQEAMRQFLNAGDLSDAGGAL